jgi:hypothetical protein
VGFLNKYAAKAIAIGTETNMSSRRPLPPSGSIAKQDSIQVRGRTAKTRPRATETGTAIEDKRCHRDMMDLRNARLVGRAYLAVAGYAFCAARPVSRGTLVRDILASPPKDWSIEREREYFDWAKQVIGQARAQLRLGRLDFLSAIGGAL